ncbi:NAD(P)-dependent oxidoreductase [Curtobacterium sp. MCBD17_003]|uniref:NAD-dependent epimerase/dehydratase family protein n=1 Tax=Curtobacterium sp. MCBD17_003 TaxID=2175667 RepID=UPI0015E8C7B6|nr:NAD(P)-dependent oxidoreductase [Curtobacterium sp. MCBD17_003]WIE54058.1 NAD(P)-dependent oxidoreductase [Curtobacterium sp. MCBD17_003]
MSARRAVVFGGTGGIGSAIVRQLLDATDDWQVDVVARRGGAAADALVARGARFVPGDRRDGALLRDVLRDGADLLVDGVAATATDARQLAPYLPDVASTVLLSTKAVYADERGRHANSLGRPVFPVPITEAQPTVPAGEGDPTSRDGYAANKVAAEQVLLDHGAPVTVLRPSKVYGVGIGRPREWWVVRRVLDDRPHIALADGGMSIDHTTAAAGVASLVHLVADAPDRRILNVADEPAPTVLDVVRTIAGHLGHRWEEVLLDQETSAFTGRSPWWTPSPVVLDTSAARTLGWQPPRFEDAVLPEVDWLVEVAQSTPADGDVPWATDPFFERLFDYGPEDAALTLLSLRE